MQVNKTLRSYRDSRSTKHNDHTGMHGQQNIKIIQGCTVNKTQNSVQLYTDSPFGPSWPILARTLPLSSPLPLPGFEPWIFEPVALSLHWMYVCRTVEMWHWISLWCSWHTAQTSSDYFLAVTVNLNSCTQCKPASSLICGPKHVAVSNKFYRLKLC